EQQIQKFQRNRRRGESADREDYDFYDITAWSLPFTFNLDAYWTEDATPLAGDAVTDTVLAAARGLRVPLQQRQRGGCPARVRAARRRVQGGDRHAAAPGRRCRVSARHVP